MSKLSYGVAYYDEYIQQDRLAKDIEMMLAAGINVVRIAESTWSTLEPTENNYNFYHIDRVLDAMYQAGIGVIVGTPTYAIPAWLAKKHPEVMVKTPEGKQGYGRRQIIDITNKYFLHYSENIIRKLLEHVYLHPGVIGYQVDNETKHYDNVGETIQAEFVQHLKSRFHNINDLNASFGLDYWSNRIDNWDDFPPIEGTINASLGATFARFRREKVAEYLKWQADILKEYADPNQFITQNFDFEWRGYSFGLQPQVDHFKAAEAMSIASVDIYHPAQDHLTGREIAFGGDVARNLKDGLNYFVMETQAQGFAKWTPYPGQLRLQAFSHIASGASMVAYWHWHSLHNSYETYWKGLLSHDFSAGPTYLEAATVGNDMAQLAETLDQLRMKNDVAILVSNDAMEAINWFKPDTPQPELNNSGHYIYNDILRRFWDALYDNNISVDIINHIPKNANKYRVLIIPALYSASDEQLEAINSYVENGGRAMVGFKTGFCDLSLKVRAEIQPAIISRSCGVSYNQFTIPDNVNIKTVDKALTCHTEEQAELWMELLTPTSPSTDILLSYDHPHWGEYAAATLSHYGTGRALYVGFLPSKELIYSLFKTLAKDIELISVSADVHWPLIVRKSVNKSGITVRFIFNYSASATKFNIQVDSLEPLTNTFKHKDDIVDIEAWGMRLFIDKI